MASAAEQLASNLSMASFSKATELKKRLWFTLGALVLFRLLSFVPIPGIDPARAGQSVRDAAGRSARFLQHFSGGSLSRMSIIALGVMPYITASIVVQLGGFALRALEGAARRKARPGARSSTNIPAT
jgi:preprotein translocase subunit SecY